MRAKSPSRRLGLRRGAPARARAGRLPALDLVTLGAVCTVVLLVSLPCLRDFAVRENESDARRLLPLLSQLLQPSAGHPGEGSAPEDLEALLERNPALASGLRDAHLSADGRTLRHHGYVFALEEPDAQGRRAVVAWPLDLGRTGRTDFRFVPAQGLFERPDPGGAWREAPAPLAGELAAAPGWLPDGR